MQADAIMEDGTAMGVRASTRGLAVGRTLSFSPISVVWRNLCYYVPVPTGLVGAAAANVMPKDHPDKELAGKKRLLNDLTGVHSLLPTV